MRTMATLRKEHLINCMFSNWYPQFAHLTMKSFILPIPDEFVQYLQQDGPLILPRGVDIGLQRKSGEDSFDDEDDWSDENEAADEDASPEFPEFIKEINVALEKLNWKSFPKLNWSSPKDAVWITMNNSLKCSTAGDVILLLKSSDFITYDLSSPFKLCESDSSVDPEYQKQLVLRKWADLVPGTEFRCFVRNQDLIAVCQRNNTQYYEYVENQRQTIPVEICKFFQDNIKNKFASSNYVVDVYKRRDGNYWIIDFSPWGLVTDPLMFSWEELNLFDQSQLSEEDDIIFSQDGKSVSLFRYAKKDATMQPSETLSYRMPQDFLDLSRGEDATKLVDFLRMKIQTENDDSSSNDDEPWQLPQVSGADR